MIPIILGTSAAILVGACGVCGAAAIASNAEPQYQRRSFATILGLYTAGALASYALGLALFL